MQPSVHTLPFRSPGISVIPRGLSLAVSFSVITSGWSSIFNFNRIIKLLATLNYLLTKFAFIFSHELPHALSQIKSVLLVRTVKLKAGSWEQQSFDSFTLPALRSTAAFLSSQLVLPSIKPLYHKQVGPQEF